ncbi:Metal-dependent hydrolase YbeY, involved in rRNA and/or ribosome maturation and assembly [hydrothermal vent metagenome]|uniref:Metal-dependent hydrolase YbeY, involved in rRNA and/or ribosome maturation and assembly n=1 Tax=hydrothermal vent metagenome TaxID=652676 RepID=A0A1W1CPD6_9ZZZZ
MLNIENQTRLEINQKDLETIANTLTTREIDLTICYNPTIQQYNLEYRGKNSPTDVLSFPLSSDLMNSGFEHLPLGSIVVSADYIMDSSKALGHGLNDELSLLFIHGLLHLLGYDHEVDSGEMRVKEEALIQKFNLPNSLIVRTEKN